MPSGTPTSAGLLVYRRGAEGIEVFLVHPGGPFWAKKDEHAWSIPKGEIAAGEDPQSAARREFAEETGFAPPTGPCVDLGLVSQSRKRVRAWAVEGDLDAAALVSDTFDLEWPPHSGRIITVPEADRGAWFGLDAARNKLHKGQGELLDRLQAVLADASLAPPGSTPEPS